MVEKMANNSNNGVGERREKDHYKTASIRQKLAKIKVFVDGKR